MRLRRTGIVTYSAFIMIPVVEVMFVICMKVVPYLTIVD